ncbi:DUF115 domain-containing protein [Shewanella sp. SP2S2-4]|uniref:6-hydroxymethylpterin diphosphokinase MptE-like protein n=1 Tax=Shewanella sp. SP2S2-4 TaxID=3063539 RepID=UPI002890EE38|nr:6-hydroxymethylpterin diphosphokinase MptE-like protein [Shewanella sp. SP2S2-4]MDT3274149.1 DUF115 domain-containing protein [Shewanella sp. SP2S2-4]
MMTVNEPILSAVFSVSQFNEYYLPSINRNTFEQCDSKTLFNNRYKAEFSHKDTLHIVIGLDSGLLANYVMELAIPDGSKFIFVDFNAVLNLLTIEVPDELSESIEICSPEMFDALLKETRNNIFIAKNQFKVHRSIAVSGNYIDEYAQLNYFVEKKIEHEHFESNIGFSQKIFIKKQLINLSETLQPASILKQKFMGKTCIVLGGGPSLDEHIDWIKSHREQLVIFAVSRVAYKLTIAGIPVDIIVSVDPQDHALTVNKEMMALYENSLFICSYHVSPLLLGQWAGSVLYTGPRIPWDSRDSDNILPKGPTVTNAAVQIAEEMGFEQILLCGSDFCHSQSGATHAKNTFGADIGPNLGVMFEWVETYSGEMAETPIQLLQAMQSLQEEVICYHAKCINLSANAARIEGIQQLSPEQLVLATITPEDRAILQPSKHKLSIEQRRKLLANTLTDLSLTSNTFNALIKLLKKALHYSNTMLKIEGTTHTVVELHRKIDKIEKTLNQKYHHFGSLIKFYGYYEFSHFLSTKQSEHWSQLDLSTNNNIYYKAYLNIATELSVLINDAASRVEIRLAELTVPTDIPAIARQWRQDNQLGRALIWKQNYMPDHQKLNDADIALLDEIEQEYLQYLSQQSHSTSAKEATVNNVEDAFKKLAILMQNQHLLGICKMIQYISPFITDNPELTRLYYLASSYQFLLLHEESAALESILNISEEYRTETELKQIILLSLKLKDITLAENTYSKIIVFSDDYLPHYAQILKLQGKYQQALDYYLNYLEKYPTDIPVLLKFGLFWKDIGQPEQAVSVLTEILTLDPNNFAAQTHLQQLYGNLELKSN